MRKSRIFLIIFSILFLNINGIAHASVTKPNFPSCKSPQGQLKVYYADGTHGIVGDQNTYIGSDAVYILSDMTLSQCFCRPDGFGIQTDWWKVSSLTIDEIETLQAEGWIYIPNGALWGLEEAPYMAKNTRYECDDDDNDDSDDDDDDDDNDNTSDKEDEGEVLGLRIGGAVLGLASTGTMLQTVVYAGVSITSLGTAFYLIRKKRDNE